MTMGKCLGGILRGDDIYIEIQEMSITFLINFPKKYKMTQIVKNLLKIWVILT